MENTKLNPLKSPSSANDPANNDGEDMVDSANAESSLTTNDNTEDSRYFPLGGDELETNHKPPKISFSENSSSIIRCMPNERATFFVKIDTEENDADILPLEFEWSRGDNPIYNSDRFRITKTSNAVQLAVEHVQREDAGHYTLFARTKGNDVIRKDVQLIVEDRSTGDDPPIFLRRLVDLQVRVGSSSRLITEIRSSTDVKLTWFRNDRRICENDRIKEVHEGTFHYLEINPVILEDGGQWMVMAENYSGRNSCISHLTVIVPKAYKAPEFIEELRAILTQQGTVSLECKVVGVPTPQLRWFKDSKEIKAGDVFALTANADDPTSLGTYTCEAVNCVGKAYSSSKLHVVGRGSREGSLKPADSVTNTSPPPIFTSELKNTSVRIGDTIILGCQVAVPPWPQSVVWYNKNGRVDTGDRYKYIEDGLGVYMIEIKPSEACDEGEWKCVVTNEESCVGISSCVVDMEIPRNYRKPRFMESLRAVLTEEGLVSFECKVVGFPTPQLKWFKDGQELKPGDVYQLTGTNSLGTYCCIAKNCMGETSSIAVLTVEDIQNQLNDEERMTIAATSSRPPRFLMGLKSQETKINEPFQFTVKVEATPDPLLSWFRDELPIEASERYNPYRGEEDNWHLDIKALEFIDQAEWKCVAVNDFGTTVTSCFLKLQIPRHYKKPRFLECLRAVLTEEGAVNLECKVIGVPQPVLKWYKDGVELKPGDIHKIISGQDGTCCLGTYTCEARNCMGVVASSAALLGFEDDYTKQETQQQNELQRNFSLSTIQEEHTSQLYETPQGDITITDKGDVSFSFDGKEVSVSLYETPDLTEEEALKIVEMYADQISEHITEHNVVELPPLRFVKETSQSGKLLMEAMVIDISPEYFSHEEDLRTEAGMDDISINEVTIHGSSLKDEAEFDKETEDFARNSFEKMEEELSLTAPIRKRKKSKPTETEEFYSFSKASEGSVDDNTSELQTFASAQMSKVESLENQSLNESLQAPARKKGKKQTDSESSKTSENEAKLQDISGAVGDGLKLTSDKPMKVVSNEADIETNLKSLLPLAKLLKILDGHLKAVEAEVINQSALLMTPSSADQSIGIIQNIIEPIGQIQSKLKVYSGETPLDSLFETMNNDIRNLHVALQVIEKCVEIDETGTTLIQRTSVCIIDSIADHLIKALDEVKTISKLFENENLKSNLELTVDDIKQGLEITKDTIKSQALLQEAQEIEANKHFTETVAKLQDIPEPLPFAKVAEANLPKFSESVKVICEPVLRIQAALEKVENELTLEETDEDIYKKVHEKIMLNLVEPINDLQKVVGQIESKVSSMSGMDNVEHKVNMAILDIVSPPLFELNKGLEIILQQPSHNIEAGKLTVSTVESMVPPLQEIQNGLAQLSQDILTGQITDDQFVDTDDLKKLLQSLAQAVLHLETNIEHITTRLPVNVSNNLSKLREEISSLISQVMDKDLDKYHLTVLENIKRPIDELNYCIRQIEQKSISGSLTDLVDPLHSLNDKVRVSQEIMQLTSTKQNNDITETLDKMRNLIKHIEIDIEENEFKNIQKEIALDEEQALKDNNLFLSMRQEMEMKIELEESLKALENLHTNLKNIQNLQYVDKEIKSQFVELSKPFEELINILKDKNLLETNKSALQSALNILRNTAKATESINNALDQLKTVKGKNEFSKIFYGKCRNDLEDLKTVIDQVEDFGNTTPAVVNTFNKILVELENVLPKLTNEVATEDMSTLEEVSALKSAAESLPLDNDRISQQKDIEETATGPLKSFEDKKVQVDELLGQLKNSIASVLAHCNEYDMGSLRTEVAKQMKATVNKMQDFQHCLEQTLQPHVLDVVQTASECTDPCTMAEAVCSLENCALQIQEYIDNFDVKDLSGDEISELKTMAQPLKELVEGVKVFYNQELEQVENMNTISAASMSSANVLQSLRPYVLAVHEHQALETLESLADTQTFSHLKEIVQPLRELEKAEENQLLSQMSNLTENTNPELLKTFAKPILNLKDAIVSVKQDQAFSSLEEYPEFQAIKEKSDVLFDLLKYCENFDANIFENLEDLSSLNISQIKTLAESKTVSALDNQELVKAHIPEVKTFDLKDCVAGGIKQIEECLHTTKNLQDIKVSSLEDIMQELKKDLQNMENNLLKSGEKTEDLIEKETKVAKTMFKLKECLVHTYESTDLETGLEDIEKTFEDLLQAMPSLELQLALEMKEKIVLGFSEFIVACLDSSHESQFENLIQPLRNLLETVDVISKLNKVDVETSSSVMVQLQTQLMTAFRVLNDISEKSNPTMVPVLLKTQNTLVSIYDFIENNEGNLRIIELLQEIDYLTPELKEIKALISLNKQRVDEEQMQVLLETVNAAQLFLTEVQEGLMENNPLVQTFMLHNQDTVEKLKNALTVVESKLQAKTGYDMDHKESVTLLTDLLNELKANIEKVERLELEIEKESVQPESIGQKQVEEQAKQEQQIEEKIETDAKASDADVTSNEKEVKVGEQTLPETKVRDEDSKVQSEKDTLAEEKSKDELKIKDEKILEEQVKAEVSKAETEMLKEEELKVTETTEAEPSGHKKLKEKSPAETKPEKDLTPQLSQVLEIIKNTCLYIHTLPSTNLKQSTSQFAESVNDNLKEIQSAINDNSPRALEDKLFLSLFKTKELISYGLRTDCSDEITQQILQNLKQVFVSIVNDNDKLRKSFIYDILQATNPTITNTVKYIEEQHQKSATLEKIKISLSKISLELNEIYQDNEGNMSVSSPSFMALKGALLEMKEVTDEISKINPNALETIKLNQLVTKLNNNELSDTVEILLELENINTMFDQLQKIIETEPQLWSKSVEETVIEVLNKIGDSNDLQDVKNDLKYSLESSNNEQKRKCIFKLREHIVHTYDGGLSEELENVVDKLLENNSELIESINTEYIQKVNETISCVNSNIDSLPSNTLQTKFSGLTTKLSNIQSIAERLKTVKDIEKSSVQMIEMQKNLMDIFVLFDDMIEMSIPNVKCDLEKVKSLALKQYDSIENATDNIKTLKVYDNIIELCNAMSDVVTNVCENEMNAKKFKTEKLEEKILETEIQKAEKKDVKAEKEKADVSEVKAEKIEEKKMETEAKKTEEKDIKLKSEKAEVTEVKAAKLEEMKLETETKKVEEKDVEIQKEKAVVSEVKPEKLDEKKLDSEAKQTEVKEVKPKAETAEVSEVKAEKLEEKEIETETQKAEEKNVRAEKEIAEVSEVKAETLEERKLETEVKKTEEMDVKSKAEKAETSEIKAEKIEEKKLDTDRKKTEETDVKSKSSKAEISEIKAEKLDEKNIQTKTQKAEEKDASVKKEKAEVSEVKTEKLEEKKLEIEAKKTEEQDVKSQAQKADVSEVKAEKIEEKKIETETLKAEEKNIKAEKENAEVSDVKTEKLEEMKLETEVKKTEEKNVKSKAEKAETSEVKAEKIEEKKLETEIKKTEETDVKSKAEKAEVSEIKAEKLEEKNIQTKTQKAEEKDASVKKEKVEVSEVKAEKLEEKKLEIEAKKTEEKDVKSQAQKADVSEVKAEKVEENKIETETQKAEEKNVRAEKGIAEVSEIKAETLEERKLETEVKKIEEMDVKTKAEKAETSEVKAEKIEEKKLDTDTKKTEETDVKSKSEKAEVSEIKTEKLEEKNIQTKPQKAEEKDANVRKGKDEVSEVIAEKLEEKKIEIETKKTEEKDLKSQALKAEISEVKAEKLEEKKIEIETKKAEEKDVTPEKGKAEESEVNARKLEEIKLQTEVKKTEEKEIKPKAENAEVSEVKVEKLEEKKIEIETKKAEEKDVKLEKRNAEESEVKAENLKEMKLETVAKKTEEKEVKAKAENAEISEVKVEKLEEKEINTETQKTEEKDVKTQIEKAESSVLKAEMKEEKNLDTKVKKIEKMDIKSQAEKAEVSEVKSENLEEKSLIIKTQKAEEKDVKAEKDKADVSEIKVEKLEEKNIETEAKQPDEKDITCKAEKAEVFEVKSEKLEEKKIETETQKTEEKEVKAEKGKAKASEVKADKIEEMKLETEAKKTEGKDAKSKAEKAEVSEVKAYELEEKKIESEVNKFEERDIKSKSEKAELSEVKVEKVVEKKLETENQKAEEIDVKAKEEKAKMSMVNAEKLESTKMETESQKTEEKDIKSEEEKAEISEVKAEKLEVNKLETEARKPKEQDVKSKVEKAEVSEIKAEKLDEKKIATEIQKAEVKDAEAKKGKSEVSEVKAEKLEEKILETETKKTKEKSVRSKAEKAEVSEVKAEKLEEKKLESNVKEIEEKDMKSKSEKAEVSEVKTEKLEEVKVETDAMKSEENSVKSKVEKAEVSEVMTEKPEEKKLETEKQKPKKKDVKAKKGKAEISEVKAEKLDEKKLETEEKDVTSKAENAEVDEKDIQSKSEKAEVSEVKANKLEEKKVEIDTQKTEEKDVKLKKEKAEVRANKVDEEKIQTEEKKTEAKDTKSEPEKAEVKVEKLEEKKIDSEGEKAEEKDINKEKMNAKASEVKAEKLEENKLETKAKTTEEHDVKPKEEKAELSEVRIETLEEKKLVTETKIPEKKDINAKLENAEAYEVKAEKLEEKKLEAEAQKAEEKIVKTKGEKAKKSKVKADKLEQKILETEMQKADEKDVTAQKGKAEASEVNAEKLEEKLIENEAKKTEEKDEKSKSEKDEVSEGKDEKLDEKTGVSQNQKIEEKKVKSKKEKSEVSEDEKLDEREHESAVNKTEKSEISEDKAVKLEEKKLEVEEKKSVEKGVEAKKEKSKRSKAKVDKVDDKELEDVSKINEFGETKERDDSVVEVEKTEILKEKQHVDVSEDQSALKAPREKDLKTMDSESEIDAKPKKSNEYMDLREQRNAKRMPCVDIKLTNRNSSVGSDIKLTCGISGNDLEVRWFKENTLIENNPKYIITQKDGLSCLEIKSADLNDAAVYRCVAANRNGEVETSCLVTLYDVPTNKFGTPPIFTRNIRDAYHSHENHITLECKVSGNPKPNIYWQKDNTLLSEEGDKYQYIDLQDGIRQLIIRNPVKEDTGLYTCYAESESGQMKISKFVDISDYMKKITERRNSRLQEELKLDKERVKEKINDEVDSNERQEQKLRSREAKFKLNVETPMKPMTIASGTKAQLICYVTGLIEDVYWLRGDERVTKDSRHKIYNINGALSLEIYDARPDDTGEYKCVVRNSRNYTESICDLEVYDSSTDKLPSSFSSPVTATFDPVRCEIILSCNVHGRPCVTWIRDDHTISNNRYRAVEEVGGIRKLIIRNPIPSDCGTFSCFAETNEGIESITKVIKITDLKKLMTAAVESETNGYLNASDKVDKQSTDVKELHDNIEISSKRTTYGQQGTTQRKPLFSTLLHDRTVAECSNVRLCCSVVYDGCTTIEWLKDSQPLPKDNRYQTIFHNGEAILEIFGADEKDSGRYTCRATNDYGESVSHSHLRVFKHYEDAPQPTTFVQSIKDSYSINENQLVLDCRVRGKPRPEIQWLKGTDMLIPGDRYIQIDQPDGYSKLIVTNPTEKDSGLYACVARNEVSESKITHQVDFKGRERFALEKTLGYFHRDPNKPHFLQPLGNQTVCGGGTIAITAEFMQTHTPIDVQWFREREPLAGQPNVKTFYEHGVYTLAIMNAQPENEGTYTCRAQNAFGRMEAHATVDVAVGVSKDERPPLFLSRPETEMKIAVGDPFSISFRIAGDPKPRLTFMKGTKDITKSDRVSKEVSDDYTRFTVQKSQISDSGTYFVVARNNNGTDRIFVTVEIKTPKKKD